MQTESVRSLLRELVLVNKVWAAAQKGAPGMGVAF